MNWKDGFSWIKKNWPAKAVVLGIKQNIYFIHIYIYIYIYIYYIYIFLDIHLDICFNMNLYVIIYYRSL